MTKEDVLRITLQRVKETLKSNEIQMDDLQEIIILCCNIFKISWVYNKRRSKYKL